MRTLITKIMIWAFITLLYASTLFAQYSNATLKGSWWLGNYPFHIYDSDNTLYIVFDGNGNVTDWSGFGPDFSGNYSVTTGGAVSASVVWRDGSASISAQLISQNFATVDSGALGENFALSRITNPGALTDSLVGVMYSNCGQKSVTLRLNSQGEIISATGLTPPVTGKVYADSGHFEGHIKTGDNTQWCSCGSLDEFTILGAYSNDSLNGVLGIDGPQGSCRDSGTVHLKRLGIVTGIGPMKTAGVPESFSLEQNFPNPFNPGTTISYQIPTQSHVTLKVFDVLGREVAVLVNEVQQAGDNTVEFHAEHIPSGVYFYRLTTGTFTETKKLVLLR